MSVFRRLANFFFFLIFWGGISLAQTPEELAQLDPSDVYFQAWLLVRDAEKLEQEKEYVQSFEKFRKARILFDHIAVNHPSWKPTLVQGRQKTTNDAMETIRPQAIEEQKKEQKNFEGLIEDPTMAQPLPLAGDDQMANQQQADNINRIDQEIIQLKRQLSETMNDRDANAARARRALGELEEERKRAVSAPVKAQLDDLNRQIAKLTSERDTLSVNLLRTEASLRQSQREHEETRQELAASRKKEAELVKLIEEQRQVNFNVVKGQQAQLADLQKKMEEKDKLLGRADAHIRNLTQRLEASQTLVDELRVERDGLLKERDQMAALLKVNAADRVQELINQNVRLSRELNEAKQRVQVLDEDVNATKDELAAAKQTLAVAKLRILRLQEDNTSQKLRLRELEERLELANQDLLAQGNNPGLNAAAREEIQTLRDIIDKLKRSVTIQEEARQLLLAQAEREATSDENWKEAIAHLKGTVVPELSEQEKDLIAQAGADFNMTNQFRPSEEERLRAGDRLQRDKSDYNRLARRAFGGGKIPIAQSFFETIIEEDPGDWEAMMNLGIVHLRQQDPAAAAENFRQAILVKGTRTIPHAHFMLGVAYYEAELLSDSEQEINTAIQLDPANAKAHVFLGNIAGRQNRLEEAEHHLKEAITLDSTLSEPHMNLSIVKLQQGRKKEALEYYREAIKRGAMPQPALEAKLGS